MMVSRLLITVLHGLRSGRKDHNTDLEMEIRMKIIESSPFGFSLTAYHQQVAANIVINKTEWENYGTLVGTGPRPSGYSGNQFYFGDGTPTGGNISAETQFVRYSNQPFSSGGEGPEPISLATWSLVACGIAISKRRRSSRRRSDA